MISDAIFQEDDGRQVVERKGRDDVGTRSRPEQGPPRP